jgi:hypothetical protein
MFQRMLPALKSNDFFLLTELFIQSLFFSIKEKREEDIRLSPIYQAYPTLLDTEERNYFKLLNG